MATAGSPGVRISRRVLDRYLLDDEVPVVATRRHWARLVEPMGTTLVGLLAAGALASYLHPEWSQVALVVWAAWFVLLARSVWHLMEWRNEWFVATDRRMLMVYGLVTHKVAMMPLAKVTDMNYGRSLLGRMLGYGQFVLESAGQEQAMRVIAWVPDPDEKYRRICATIFGQHPDDVPARGGEGPADAFDEEVGNDPFEATFSDEQASVVDRFDTDIVRVRTAGRGGGQEAAAARAPRRPRWEPVERSELPPDWTWLDEEAAGARRATRRRVAVDPDPTPPGPAR